MQRPNMALTKNLDKSNWSLIFERPKNVKEERRRGEEEEEEEKEEEKKKRKEGERKSKRYGTMNSCMNFHAIAWLVACPKPRV